MTFSSLVPWIIDSFNTAADNFDLYVNNFSILISKNLYWPDIYDWSAWHKWKISRPITRVCPRCMRKNNPVIMLAWSFPFLLTCEEHSCLLRTATVFGDNLATLNSNDEDLYISKPLLQMDQRSWRALKSGSVNLSHKTVNMGSWFRIIRSVINEISISLSRVRKHEAVMLKKIWARTGYSYRHGVKIWKPFEELPYNVQTKYLIAAATAMHMLESNIIISSTKDSDLFGLETSPSVCDGIRQKPRIQDMTPIFNRHMTEAKTDRNMAIDMFFFLLMGKDDDETIFDTKSTLLTEYKIPKRYLSHIDRLIPFYRA